MFRRTWPFALLLVAGTAAATIIVGHPVEVVPSGGTGLTISGGWIDVSDVVYYECDDTPHTYAVDDRIDLWDDLGVPVGTWCGVDIVLDGPFRQWGTGINGGTYDLTLSAGTISIDLDHLVVHSDYTSDADLLRLAYPGWITATSLGLGPNVNKVVTSSSPEHGTLRSAVLGGSAILN
jgi:hypothetical protein